MSADELLQAVTNILFGLVFLAAMMNAARRPQRVSVDLALLFTFLAVAIGLGLLPGLEGEAKRWVSVLAATLIMAVPYGLIRLAQDFAEVPRAIVRLALAGLALSVVGVVALEPPLPIWFTLGLIVYFAVFASYAGIAVWREAARSGGVARRRAQAIASGALLLGVALLAAGVQIAVPAVASVVRLLALGSALAFFVGVSPPAILRRSWQMPSLLAYLTTGVNAARWDDPKALVVELERAAAEASGATRAAIGLWDDAAGVLRFRGPDGTERLRAPGDGIAGRAFALQRTVYEADPTQHPKVSAAEYRSLGARGAFAAPLTVGDRRIGVLFVAARHQPLFVEDDIGFVGLLADQAAIALDAARAHEELLRASRAKSEFLSNMSHELRTPMNAILGFTELLQEQLGGSLNERQRRYFGNIRDAGQHLLELVNDVLDLSKVEAGRVELHREVISLDDLVAPIVAAAKAEAAKRDIELDAHVSGGAADVDPGRMRQILYNLLSNALKFTPQGRVGLRAALDGRALVIEVSDTGIGIPADARDRVFGMFERLHEGRSKASGTGLGLALTKRLVELHGGTITFESEDGAGTTFRVHVPDAAAELMTGDRILVVEDDARDAELIAELARQVGLRTEIVTSADSALAAVRRDPPRAVVLDLRLRDERGERVLETLKADQATRRISVVVVTVEDDEGRSLALGADAHLVKPIDRARLTAWLRRLGQNGMPAAGARAAPATASPAK